MMAEAKTPFHKHAHPAYGWIALIVSTVLILGVAGWYYLTITQGYNDEVLNTVKETAGPVKQTSAARTTSPIDVKAETTKIDTAINSTSDADFSDTQLDNTILGINN